MFKKKTWQERKTKDYIQFRLLRKWNFIYMGQIYLHVLPVQTGYLQRGHSDKIYSYFVPLRYKIYGGEYLNQACKLNRLYFLSNIPSHSFTLHSKINFIKSWSSSHELRACLILTWLFSLSNHVEKTTTSENNLPNISAKTS